MNVRKSEEGFLHASLLPARLLWNEQHLILSHFSLDFIDIILPRAGLCMRSCSLGRRSEDAGLRNRTSSDDPC